MSKTTDELNALCESVTNREKRLVGLLTGAKHYLWAHIGHCKCKGKVHDWDRQASNKLLNEITVFLESIK